MSPFMNHWMRRGLAQFLSDRGLDSAPSMGRKRPLHWLLKLPQKTVEDILRSLTRGISTDRILLQNDHKGKTMAEAR